MSNIDNYTVEGFGDEWNSYNQSELSNVELNDIFNKYFAIFPFNLVDKNSLGFDMGCGSGRWASVMAPRIGTLYCIDPSSAINVAKNNLKANGNCIFVNKGVSDHGLKENSMDFGYSLGVLHHIPDTYQALKECVGLLKNSAPFLIYLYYALDNKPFWYKMLWKISDIFRFLISKMPFKMRLFVSKLIAFFIYYPIARFSSLLEKLDVKEKYINKVPLSFYRKLSFYTMQTDALDRFGTKLEQRFTKKQIQKMMIDAGLSEIRFSDKDPFWCAVGIKV